MRQKYSTSMMGGLALLLVVFVTQLLATCVFALGFPLNGFIFPVAVLVAFGLVGVKMRWCRQWRFISLWGIAAIAATIATCAILSDNSFDGNFYHQEGIAVMLGGWNPLEGKAEGVTLWVNHYAKSLEIISASISATTHNIESGKAVNLFIAVAAAMLFYNSLRVAFPQLGVKRRLIVTLVLAANPIVLSQALTFYNDFALYCYMMIVAGAFMVIYCNREDAMSWAIAIIATALAINSKFTHFFYIGIVWVAFLTLLMIKRRFHVAGRGLVMGIVALLVGVVVLGYHPYLTNWTREGSPFYPLVGGDVDIMTKNTPEMYQDGNRVVNFAKSLTSTVADEYSTQGETYSMTLFPTTVKDLKTLTCGSRVNGFGPWFALLLIVSLVSLIMYSRAWESCYVAGWIIAGCFFFEQSWWARYIPFLWALPGIALIEMSRGRGDTDYLARMFRVVIYLGVVATALVATAISLYGKVEMSMYRATLYEAIGDKEVRVELHGAASMRYKLSEAGVKYVETPADSLNSSRSVYYYGTGDLEGMPVIELDSAAYARVTTPGWRYRFMRIDMRLFHDAETTATE